MPLETDTFFRLLSAQTIRKRGCPSLVGSRPAKSVVHVAARVQIPHPALFPRVIIKFLFKKQFYLIGVVFGNRITKE
jgi:hypothetical protein